MTRHKNKNLLHIFRLVVIIFCVTINGSIWAGCNNVKNSSKEESLDEEEKLNNFSTKDFQHILSLLENENFEEFYHNFGNG